LERERLNDVDNMQTYTWVLDILLWYIVDDRFLENHSSEELYSKIIPKYLPLIKYITHEFKGAGYLALDEESW